MSDRDILPRSGSQGLRGPSKAGESNWCKVRTILGPRAMQGRLLEHLDDIRNGSLGGLLKSEQTAMFHPPGSTIGEISEKKFTWHCELNRGKRIRTV